MLEKRRSFLLTSLGVVIFAVYLAYSNPFRVILEVGRLDVIVFILAVAINYLGLFFFAYSWYLLLKVLKVRISLWDGVRAMFVSLFIVWMIPIPVGTEIIRAYMVRDKENSDMVIKRLNVQNGLTAVSSLLTGPDSTLTWSPLPLSL